MVPESALVPGQGRAAEGLSVVKAEEPEIKLPKYDSILKSRDITLPTKFRLVKAMVFPESCIDVRVEL